MHPMWVHHTCYRQGLGISGTGAAHRGPAADLAEPRPPWGGVPIWLSSRGRFGVAVVGAVAEHGVEDIAAAAGQADQGGVVLLALGPLAVVVGPAGRVGQCGEGGEKERAFELTVAGPCRVLALDAGAGAAGDRPAAPRSWPVGLRRPAADRARRACRTAPSVWVRCWAAARHAAACGRGRVRPCGERPCRHPGRGTRRNCCSPTMPFARREWSPIGHRWPAPTPATRPTFRWPCPYSAVPRCHQTR